MAGHAHQSALHGPQHHIAAPMVMPEPPRTTGHAGMRHDGQGSMLADLRDRFWVCLALTVPIVFLSPVVQEWLDLTGLRFRGQQYVLLLLSAVVYGFGGWPFLRGAWAELRRAQPGMMTLVAVAVSAAFFYSAVVVFGAGGDLFFWEAATLVDIMLLGHWIEMRSTRGTSRALDELARLLPSEVHLMQGQGVFEVPLATVRPGERVLIKPGGKIPVDGRVVRGDSWVNEAVLTGESAPVAKSAGSRVIGGSINGDGSLEVIVDKTGADTYLSQIGELVVQAQQSGSRTRAAADRVAFWLTVVALSVGALSFVIWMLIGRGFEFALSRAITVIVIACPHALGLAVPLVIAVSVGLAARHGLLIRDGGALERACAVNAVVFDKTGTLTEGRFAVVRVWTVDGHTEAEMLRLAASAESESEHPIARGIVAEAVERGLPFSQPEAFKVISGQGVEAQVDGHVVRVVGPGYFDKEQPAAPQSLTGRPVTVSFVVKDGQLIGGLALADEVRPEAAQVIEALHRLGVQSLMVTGDNETVANWVANELRLNEHYSGVSAHLKADKIRQIQERGYVVAMVGDGINDGPALAQADVGVAIGAGTDFAVESADVVLVTNDTRALVRLLVLARATRRKMIQNLAWAVGYNVVAIPLAAGILARAGLVLSPALGAALMTASTIIVVVNARLLGLARSPQTTEGGVRASRR